MNIAIGDKVQFKTSIVGIGYSYCNNDIVGVTESNIRQFESFVRSGVCELIRGQLDEYKNFDLSSNNVEILPDSTQAGVETKRHRGRPRREEQRQ
jgi:hypothetical protein